MIIIVRKEDKKILSFSLVVMTEVFHLASSPSTTSSSSPLSASSDAASLSCTPNAFSCGRRPSSTTSLLLTLRDSPSGLTEGTADCDVSRATGGDPEEQEEEEEEAEEERRRLDQLSLLTLLVAIFRKSLVACRSRLRGQLCSMEIGCPTNVRHVAHVTFDRFNGFLGLPVEFEPEVPRRAPSASATVFGVSTESMQLSFDSRGNCVPTILLLMQNCLYSRGGLQAEGIFRITAENSEEEMVREQLNGGVIPESVDVHCLAGLIKAWFRELPSGVLDSLSPEQVMQSQTEEDCVELVRLLPHTEASLLDWAINLMADVVQHEHLNKMNSRNIAMVFAPNMTQMADPLTALMYAVQVMNFLKTLIERTLREREDSVLELDDVSRPGPSDKSGHQSPSQPCVSTFKEDTKDHVDAEPEEGFLNGKHSKENVPNSSPSDEISDEDAVSTQTRGKPSFNRDQSYAVTSDLVACSELECRKGNSGQTSGSSIKNETTRGKFRPPAGKGKGLSNLSRIDSRVERVEAWR